MSRQANVFAHPIPAPKYVLDESCLSHLKVISKKSDKVSKKNKVCPYTACPHKGQCREFANAIGKNMLNMFYQHITRYDLQEHVILSNILRGHRQMWLSCDTNTFTTLYNLFTMPAHAIMVNGKLQYVQGQLPIGYRMHMIDNTFQRRVMCVTNACCWLKTLRKNNPFRFPIKLLIFETFMYPVMEAPPPLDLSNPGWLPWAKSATFTNQFGWTCATPVTHYDYE